MNMKSCSRNRKQLSAQCDWRRQCLFRHFIGYNRLLLSYSNDAQFTVRRENPLVLHIRLS